MASRLDDEIALLSPDYYITLEESSGSVCSPTTGSGTLNSNTGGGHNLDPGTSLIQTVNPLPCQRLEEAGGSNNDWLLSSGFSMNLLGNGQAFTLIFVTEFEQIYDDFTDSNRTIINLFSSGQTDNFFKVHIEESSNPADLYNPVMICQGQHSDGVNSRSEECTYVIGDNPHKGHIWAVKFDGTTFEDIRVYKDGVELAQEGSSNNGGTAGYTVAVDRLYINTSDGVTASDNRITIRNVAIWLSEVSSDDIRTLALDGVGVAPEQVEIARQSPDYYWPLQNQEFGATYYLCHGPNNHGAPLVALPTKTIEDDFQFAIDDGSGTPVYRFGADLRASGNAAITTQTILNDWPSGFSSSSTSWGMMIEFVPVSIFDFNNNTTGHAELISLRTDSGAAAANVGEFEVHLVENTATAWPFHVRVRVKMGAYEADLDFPGSSIPFDAEDATVLMVNLTGWGTTALSSSTCQVYANNVALVSDGSSDNAGVIGTPDSFEELFICAYTETDANDIEAHVRNVALFTSPIPSLERGEILSEMQGFDGKSRESLAETATNTDAPTEFLRLPESIAETISAVDDVTETFKFMLAESITASDAVSFAYSQILALADTATTSDTLTDVYTQYRTLTETINASDLMYNTIAALMAEVINGTDTATVTSDFVNRLAETIEATDQVQAIQAYLELLAVTASVVDTSSLAFSHPVDETISATDVVNDLYIFTEAVLETLLNVDSVTELRRAVVFIDDSLELNDLTLNNQIFGLLLQDQATFIGIVEQGTESDQHYTFVTNTKTLGLSEYAGYNFNSLSDGFAANSTGIYSLGGTDDNSASIIPEIVTGMMDFGSDYKKQVPYHYLWLTNN